MAYDYTKERPGIFTEDGQAMFLKVRDTARVLISEAGAARCQEILRHVTGDSWQMLACLDRLVELGELREVTAGMNVAGQDRIYTMRY